MVATTADAADSPTWELANDATMGGAAGGSSQVAVGGGIDAGDAGDSVTIAPGPTVVPADGAGVGGIVDVRDAVAVSGAEGMLGSAAAVVCVAEPGDAAVGATWDVADDGALGSDVDEPNDAAVGGAVANADNPGRVVAVSAAAAAAVLALCPRPLPRPLEQVCAWMAEQPPG